MPEGGLPAGPPRPLARHRPHLRRPTLWIALALAAFGLVLYLPGMANPSTVTFDELHYVTVARHHAGGEFINRTYGDRALPFNYEHPPTAKYLLWASVEAFGDNPVGWRLPSALLAASALPAAFLAARRLFDSLVAGVAAAALLALDNLTYLHAGMAMLEAPVAALTLWAFALALGGARERRASALVYGLAVATKYNAIFLAPAFFALHWLRRRESNPYARTALSALWTLAVPLGVLLVTYLPYFLLWAREGGLGFAATNWFLVQIAALGWDFGADADHAYASAPWTWFAMHRPVHYHAASPGPGLTEHIYSLGNPLLWWPAALLGLAALTAVPARFVARHGRRLASAALWNHAHRLRPHWSLEARLLAAATLAASAYLPYFLLQRITFLYYMTAVVPFLALLVAGALACAWHRGGRWRTAAIVYVGLTAAAFVFYLPYSEGFPIPTLWDRAIFGSIPWMRR